MGPAGKNNAQAVQDERQEHEAKIRHGGLPLINGPQAGPCTRWTYERRCTNGTVVSCNIHRRAR